MEHAYRQFALAAGTTRNLYQAFTTTQGFHCLYTTPQLTTAVTAMDTWLRTGRRPTAASFPPALGFDNNVTPQPWFNPIDDDDDHGDDDDDRDEHDDDSDD
jgi:hypothetical protein